MTTINHSSTDTYIKATWSQLPSNSEADPICPICREDMNASPETRIYYHLFRTKTKPVVHAYHPDCILDWRGKSGNTNCVTCTQSIDLPLTHRHAVFKRITVFTSHILALVAVGPVMAYSAPIWSCSIEEPNYILKNCAFVVLGYSFAICLLTTFIENEGHIIAQKVAPTVLALLIVSLINKYQIISINPVIALAISCASYYACHIAVTKIIDIKNGVQRKLEAFLMQGD